MSIPFFDIEHENWGSLHVEVLLKILGAQHATAELMVKLADIDMEKKLQLMAEYDKAQTEIANNIYESIYTRMAHVDIDKIINSNPSQP